MDVRQERVHGIQSFIFPFLFLLLTLFVYYALRDSFRHIFLLVASLILFAWSQWNYFWGILANIAVNYAGAYLVVKISGAAKRKIVLSFIVLLNFGFYFRYFNCCFWKRRA